MLVVLIIVVGIIMLAFSYVATIVYADDGYPAPIGEGYPIGYPELLPGYPVYTGYPIFDPVQMPDYPEPKASSPELSSNPVQLEPITPQYRNGRNLWQEILFKFSKLLELMK